MNPELFFTPDPGDAEDHVTPEKIDLMVTAVKKNDICFLRLLPETIKWHICVHPETGDTLLHTAVTENQKGVFDYLLSTSGFPLDQKNNDGKTAFDFCLKYMTFWDDDFFDFQHFACELLKRGASVDRLDSRSPNEDETLLHFSVRKRKVQMCKLLIQMGYDVNARNGNGITPIWLCLLLVPARDLEEIALALLVHGADPNLGQAEAKSDHNAFEHTVMWFLDFLHLQEVFFFLMIDDYTSMDVHIEILLHLASSRSPFFHNTLEHTQNLIVPEDELPPTITGLVFSVDLDYLDRLIQKFPKAMSEFFFKLPLLRWAEDSNTSSLLASCEQRLTSDPSRCVSSHKHIVKWLPDTYSAALEHACFFLSYGVKFNEFMLSTMYEQFGFGDLIKFILRAEEIKPGFVKWCIPHLLLLRDVNCNLGTIFMRYSLDEVIDLSELLYYFSDAQLRELCSNDTRPEVVAAVQNQPNVPLLVELARNVFRKFFVKTFDIKHAQQFYRLMDKLPVASIHKKIITYESKLY